MDGSNLILVVMPIVIGVTLAVMISLPYVGGRQESRRGRAERLRSQDFEAAFTTFPPPSATSGRPSPALTQTAGSVAAAEDSETEERAGPHE